MPEPNCDANLYLARYDTEMAYVPEELELPQQIMEARRRDGASNRIQEWFTVKRRSRDDRARQQKVEEYTPNVWAPLIIILFLLTLALFSGGDSDAGIVQPVQPETAAGEAVPAPQEPAENAILPDTGQAAYPIEVQPIPNPSMSPANNGGNPTVVQGGAPIGGASVCGPVYTVVSGDTLSGIAQQCGVPIDTILHMNPQIENPSLIYPGDTIQMP